MKCKYCGTQRVNKTHERRCLDNPLNKERLDNFLFLMDHPDADFEYGLYIREL